MSGVTAPPWRSRVYLASGKVGNKSIASFQAHQACPLDAQLLTYRFGAANRRFGPHPDVGTHRAIGHRPHRHIGPPVESELPLRVGQWARATASSTRDVDCVRSMRNRRFEIANQKSNARETRGKSCRPLAASGR